MRDFDYLREENGVPREQLGDRRLRLTDNQRRQRASKAKELGRKLLAELATIAKPETLLAWHRRLITGKYDGSGKRGPGRPHTACALEAPVVRMAAENRDWGYRRIQCALSNLGHELARSTIAEFCSITAFRVLELALYHSLDKLLEPESTHNYF